MDEDFPQVEASNGVCGGCIQGGNQQQSFLKERQASQPRVVVHIDICRPMTT